MWIDPTGLCWTGLDTLQAALDVGGLIPGLGEPLDLINAGISAARGNWGDAGLSALGAVPFVGWLGAAGKGAKYANKAGDLAGTARKGARAAGRLGGHAHRAKVAEVAAEYEAKGFDIIAGGGKAEVSVPTASGRRRFPDIIAQHRKTKAMVYINVGHLNKSGDLVGREARALDDLATVGLVDFRPF